MFGGYTENVRRWLELAEVDYIGPFVKAWLAFNAWYRSVYTHRTDRAILDEFRWQPNIIRNRLLPLLTDAPNGRDGTERFRPSEEAEQFRAYVGYLHHRLEHYHIHSAHGGERERITFTNVFLRAQTVTARTQHRYGWTYSVTPGTGNASLTVLVQRRSGSNVLTVNQARFDLGGLQMEPAFRGLSPDQQGTLLSVYRLMNPRVVIDLTNNGSASIRCGAYDFGCTAEDLFAGLCEVLYSMRCSLFHGELVPDPEAVACYEPAYRILRRFLSSIA